MDNSLTNELVQLQKSRCGLKYFEIVDDYVQDIPRRVSKSINHPINSLNKNISILKKYEGRMLYSLERRFFASLRRLRRYKK